MLELAPMPLPALCPNLTPTLRPPFHSQPISQPISRPGDAESPLHVRCVELHTYLTGGSLLNPGHRDNGSVLTLSALLSEPSLSSGGEFVTYMDGYPVAHTLARGDAILFRSERLHNVSTVKNGTRQSLVVELWQSGTNRRDRFS